MPDTFVTSITDTIGDTPLLRLDRIAEHLNLDGRIFAKLEHLNPGFSKKDRIALGMIEAGERSGRLQPGQPVVEMTSGNTGIGAALVCAAKGYPFICVMSRGNSIERVKMVEALGGEVVLVDQMPDSKPGKVSGADLKLVEEEAQRIQKQRGAFYLDQFNNDENATAQESGGDEMWTQSGGAIDVFADFLGTGGTFAGYAQALKRHNPDIVCVAVEPLGCAWYKNEIVEGATHSIQGGGYSQELPVIAEGLIDDYVTVNDAESVEMTRLLAEKEGVFAGFSSGANLAAAIKLLQGDYAGKSIGIVVNDCGLKYMSTTLFD